jgi:hypothetical protein
MLSWPEHIGHRVLLLCDDAAACINGVILPVEGGDCIPPARPSSWI